MSLLGKADGAGLPSLMPPDALEQVTLLPRTSGETFGPGVGHTARRKPAPAELLATAGAVFGQTHQIFQLFAADPDPEPKPGDRLTDAAGGRWSVLSVEARYFRTCWDLLCLREK